MLVDSTISRAEHDWLLGHSPSLSNFHSAVDTDEMPSAGRFFALEFNAPKKGGKAEILQANLRSTSMTQMPPPFIILMPCWETSHLTPYFSFLS